ncbi:hypothetical protein [Celeribacter sp.]|uniref:hypothetical protein n=1 Tax=Celeribacter sp. TaxID=1890673 RepID=UPI003A901D3E
MLQQTLKPENAVAVSAGSAHLVINVIAFTDWDAIPMDMSQIRQGFQMSLLHSDNAHHALSHLHGGAWKPDVLVVDEDFFGAPEAAADACLQIRRTYPDIRIVALESEIWEGESVLFSLGICHAVLPAKACGQTVLRSLRQLH